MTDAEHERTPGRRTLIAQTAGGVAVVVARSNAAAPAVAISGEG